MLNMHPSVCAGSAASSLPPNRISVIIDNFKRRRSEDETPYQGCFVKNDVESPGMRANGKAEGATNLESSIRFSGIASDAPDEEVFDVLGHELRPFGAIGISLVHELSDRHANVVFTSPERSWWCWKTRVEKVPLMIRGKKLIAEMCCGISAEVLTPSSIECEIGDGGSHGSFGEQRPRKKHKYISPESPTWSVSSTPAEDRTSTTPAHITYKILETETAQLHEKFLATRTLYVGKLEPSKSEEDIARVFGRYGRITGIKIFRSEDPDGLGYAFIDFADLLGAERCKAFLHDKYFGRVRIVVDYAQLKPSSTLWVSGLTRRSTAVEMFQVFSNFGKIVDIDGDDGEASRHVTFASVEEAQAALFSIRSQGLTGHFRKVVVDVAGNWNMEQCDDSDEVMQHTSTDRGDDPLEEGECTPEPEPALASPVPEDCTDELVASTEVQLLDGDCSSNYETQYVEDEVDVCDFVECSSSKCYLEDLATPVFFWTGSFCLRKSTYLASMKFVSGDASVLRKLLLEGDGLNSLCITKKLRMTKPLENIKKYTSSKYSHAISIATQYSSNEFHGSDSDSGSSVEPLAELVSYLKTRIIAGVIVVQHQRNGGVLFLFPPCSFIRKLLADRCPELDLELTEDLLVVLAFLADA